MVKIEDPGSTKLLAQRDNIMKLVNDYSDSLGQANVELKQSFDDYFATVTQRNNAVVHYNYEVIVPLIQAEISVQEQAGRLETISSQRESLRQINSPTIAAFVEEEYFNSTAEVLQLLHHARRAFVFWSLTENSNVSPTILRNDFAGDGRASFVDQLIHARDKLSMDFDEFLEKSKTSTESFDSGPVRHELTRRELRQLCTKGITWVNIDPVTETMNGRPFSYKANIRLKKMRFYLDGLERKEGAVGKKSITIKLTHDRQDSIVDITSEIHLFQRNAFTTQFEYEVGKEADPVVDGVSQADDFALSGPFTTWTVELAGFGFDNYPFDLSKVTSAYFNFYGTFQPFLNTPRNLKSRHA